MGGGWGGGLTRQVPVLPLRAPARLYGESRGGRQGASDSQHIDPINSIMSDLTAQPRSVSFIRADGVTVFPPCLPRLVGVKSQTGVVLLFIIFAKRTPLNQRDAKMDASHCRVFWCVACGPQCGPSLERTSSGSKESLSLGRVVIAHRFDVSVAGPCRGSDVMLNGQV